MCNNGTVMEETIPLHTAASAYRTTRNPNFTVMALSHLHCFVLLLSDTTMLPQAKIISGALCALPFIQPFLKRPAPTSFLLIQQHIAPADGGSIVRSPSSYYPYLQRNKIDKNVQYSTVQCSTVPHSPQNCNNTICGHLAGPMRCGLVMAVP